jgi:ubiquinone/menaquinone biosynthesis C-methylase UbiE
VSDRRSLREQYGTGANLSARIALHVRFWAGEVTWHQWLLERLRFPDDALILELGCGTGLLWRALADQVPSSASVVLTDVSEGMLREARAATFGLAARFDPVAADAQRIPCSDGAFGVVIASNMLYHVPDLDLALQEVRRVLGDDGTFYASTISERHLWQLQDLVSNEAPDAPTMHSAIQRFSAENGLERLRQWFPRVDAEPFDGELRVTQADAVAAYVRSTGLARTAGDDAVARVTAGVQREIDREGAFRLDTRNALFSCRSA